MTWEIRFSIHPWIHPEDAANAVRAKLQSREYRRRAKRISAERLEEEILQDLFIASLVNDRPWNEMQLEQLQKISDKNFHERLERAIATNKPPTWAPIDVLILKNWRKLHLKPAFEAKHRELPGLWDWNPKAIEGLFSHAGILNPDYDGNFENWFKKRRQRLGLRGKNRYLIENFVAAPYATKITRRGGTRKSHSVSRK